MIGRRAVLSGVSAMAMAGVALRVRLRAAHAAVVYRVMHSDAEWRARLTADQYTVLRRQGTEYPNSSPLAHETRPGRYACVGCEQMAFDASTKYDSHTGWPSFWAPLPGAVEKSDDASIGMMRTEIHCTNCGGHLGHVFDDGPRPTGLRYCMNGVALSFHPVAS